MDYIYKAKEIFKYPFRIARNFFIRPLLLREKWNSVYAEWMFIRQSEKYNIMLPAGLGDTRFMIQISQKLEKKLGGEIVFFIRPSHEIIFKMFSKSNYAVMQSMDCERDVFLHSWKNSKRKPEIGRLFLGHWHFCDNLKNLYEYSMFQSYCKFWDIDFNESDYLSPSFFPGMPKNVLSKKIDYDKTVLLCPETLSGGHALYFDLFKDISKTLKSKGYSVIANISNPKNNLPFAENMNMDLEDMIAVASNVKFIISARSGFCDIMAEKKEKLFIIYMNIKIKIVD